MQTISRAVEPVHAENLGTTRRRSIALNGIPADLDPFDRMLLATDGTVTALLESCTGGPIATTTTRQSGPATLDSLQSTTGWWWRPDASLLELGPAETVIARRAVLSDPRRGTAFVLAESLVVPHRLPPDVADRLRRPGASIGRLLAADSVETRREIVQITTIRAGAASAHLGVPPDAPLACRTYRIQTNRQTAALITEMVPPGRLAAVALGGLGPQRAPSRARSTPFRARRRA